MDLHYEYYIAAKPEDVWQVLVSAEGVSKTLYGCIIRSTFRVGDELAYIGPGNDGDETVHVYGKLLEFEPNRIFSYWSIRVHPTMPTTRSWRRASPLRLNLLARAQS